MIHYPELNDYGNWFDEQLYEPMKVTMQMQSTVVTTDYIFLDGLISSAVYKECIPDYFNIPENRNDLIYIPLPLKRYGFEHPFYAASIGFSDRIIEGIDYWRKRTEIESKKKIQIGSGQYKLYDMPIPTMWAQSWFFYANGNMKEIRRLLQKHISAIGKKCSQGFGAIKEISIESHEHDWSVIKNGVPMRPIPVSEAQIFNIDCNIEMYYAYRPPYWHRQNFTQCYMPMCRV
jgi:hypothetical protein